MSRLNSCHRYLYKPVLQNLISPSQLLLSPLRISLYPQRVLSCTPPHLVTPFRSSTFLLCNSNRPDMVSQLELGKPEERRKLDKQVNGIFWIILLNLGIFVADHFFQVQAIKSLYFYHNRPAWFQCITATFCHADW